MFEDLPEKQAWEQLLESFFEAYEIKKSIRVLSCYDNELDLKYSRAKKRCKEKFDKYMGFVIEREKSQRKGSKRKEK